VTTSLPVQKKVLKIALIVICHRVRSLATNETYEAIGISTASGGTEIMSTMNCKDYI
jgi:hypothetical protein